VLSLEKGIIKMPMSVPVIMPLYDAYDNQNNPTSHYDLPLRTRTEYDANK
jgi:hypothetical protein